MPDLRFAGRFAGDLQDILAQSDESGTRLKDQAYIAEAFRRLAAEPLCLNSKDRSAEIGPGVRTFHLRHVTGQLPQSFRLASRPVHTILYRYEVSTDVVRILALIHDRRELSNLIIDQSEA